MKLRNKSGVTLIALIVTIIVLIIIAGISIATLTTDDGVLKQVNSSKVLKIEGTAREQVKLATAAMRLAIAEAAAKDNSYSAVEHANAIQMKLLETIRADSTGLDENEESWTSSIANDGDTEFTITYVGQDYKNACNYDNAEIVYTIRLSQRTVEITNEVNATLKDQNGNDVVFDVGSNTGNIYLVDVVEIGDYVDIEIDYTNQYSFTSGYTTATSGDELTGWRVLSISGSGVNGTVTLVSAGTPLTFYHPYSSTGYSESSLEYLTDLNTEITLVGSGTQGFVTNGLSSENLASIWSSNNRINTSAGVHALTTSEAETAYAEITGVSKTINELYSAEYAFRTSYMQMAATENRKDDEHKR